MSLNAKLTWGLAAVVVLALVSLFIYVGSRPAANEQAIAEQLVRSDSQRLGAAGGQVTVVEFLDFECPSCAAAYPGVEQLRAEYGDRVSYVVRFFPIASHPNARTAAAAYAAGEQGAFEQMYRKLFETQQNWAGVESSQAEVFERYAEDLGLDLDQFRSDVVDPAATGFIERDQADGVAVGVTGTPTFFVDGERFAGVANGRARRQRRRHPRSIPALTVP